MNPYAVYLDLVSFSHENTLVLKELSLKVKTGEHIEIIGDSGAARARY